MCSFLVLHSPLVKSGKRIPGLLLPLLLERFDTFEIPRPRLTREKKKTDKTSLMT